MAISPIASVQSFVNNNAAVQNVRTDPRIKARLLQQSAGPGVDATFNARQSALAEKANEINAWGQNITQIQQQGRMQREIKKVQEEAKKVQAAQAGADVTSRVTLSGSRAGVEVGRTSNSPLPAATGTGTRAKVIQYAQGMLGTPYAWGGGGVGNKGSRGTGKGTQGVVGVDCSGLTSYVYGMIGVNLNRKSDKQLTQGVKTSIANAQPGDLVGWGPGGHVAIYAGNGMIIESPKPGGRVQTRKLGSGDNSRGVYAVRLRLPGE